MSVYISEFSCYNIFCINLSRFAAETEIKMIVGINKAVLHILDAVSGVTVYSDTELDASDAAINNFISRHIEKVYDSAALRSAEFTSGSGLKYHINEYLNGDKDFVQLSQAVAERMYEGISASEDPESCDIIVCDCTANETPVIAVLKCDNKIGYTHQVMKEDGHVKNMLINHYAILPTISQRISECAFINTNDFSIKYEGKKRKIDGEATDLIADILLECVFDISPRESINAVSKIAKKVTDDNGGDSVETISKLKQYVTENAVEEEYIEPKKIAEAVFDGRPVMRDEFMEKISEATVPEKVEVSPYITKKMSSNVKLKTDIGVELSFPAEYYRDNEHIEIINNEDGTLSIKINNIGEIINK